MDREPEGWIDRVPNGLTWLFSSPQTVLGSEKNSDVDARIEKELCRRRSVPRKASVVRNEAHAESGQDMRRVSGEDLNPGNDLPKHGLLRGTGRN